MSTKLYVGNLPYQTTESDLQELFEGSGPVKSVNIVRDKATGQARGFAFVEMNDAEAAQRAISELDRYNYGGRNLTVNEAKPMTPRGDRGGNGFSRNDGRTGGFNRPSGNFGGGRQRGESRW
jgi:RNA recognition motif-containing protein